MKSIGLAAAAAVATIPATAHAQSWNATDAYFATSGGTSTTVSSPFTFGYFQGLQHSDPLTAFTLFYSGNTSSAYAPGIAHVGVYGSTIDQPAGTAFYREGFLNLHPGQGGQTAAIEFVAPTAGLFNFAGLFRPHDIYPAGVTVGAYSGSTTYLASTSMFQGQTVDFNFNTALAAGQAVRFFVNDLNGDAYDSTGFQLAVSQISAVPEPSTWAMMLVGFGGVGFAMRRAKKADRQLAIAAA